MARQASCARLACAAALLAALVCARAEEAAANATAVEGAAVNATAANATVAEGFNADGSLTKNTAMDPPQISVGGIAGLLVGFVLLLILVPGLMCLYNIESPQAFDQMDKDDAKKKMQ